MVETATAGVVVVAVLLSGVFSGGEIGVYQLSRVRLRLDVMRGTRLARMLSEVVADRGALLMAILVGNNLTIQVGTTLITFLLLTHLDRPETAEWMATVLTTPVFFAFGELIPKHLFLLRADRLLPWIAPILIGAEKTLRACGVIPLLLAVNRLAARWMGAMGPTKKATEMRVRHEMAAIVQDTVEEGLVSGVQTDLMHRLMVASMTPVKSVMTPWRAVVSVPQTADRRTLLGLLRRHDFTRLVVTGRHGREILGVVHVYECLAQMRRGQDVTAWIHPLMRVDPGTPVTEVLQQMQQQGHRMVLIARQGSPGQTVPLGVATLKDVVEELLGELSVW